MSKWFKTEATEIAIESIESSLLALRSNVQQSDYQIVLAGVLALRKNVDGLMESAVKDSRESGKTWQDIGDALGISRQGAFQRYGRVEQSPSKERSDRIALRAATLIGVLAAGNYSGVTSTFSTELANRLSESQLEATWLQVLAAVGNLDKTGAANVRQLGLFTVVDIELAFEAGDLLGRFSFSDLDELSGLFILDPQRVI